MAADEKDILECQQNFKMHDEILRAHNVEMAEMRLVITTIPVQMQHLTKQIEDLCKTIKEERSFFISKEYYEARKLDVDRHFAEHDKEIESLWTTHNGKINAAELRVTAAKEDGEKQLKETKETLEKKIEKLQDKLTYAIVSGLGIVAWAFISNHFFKGH